MALGFRVERELLGLWIETPKRGAVLTVGPLANIWRPDVAFGVWRNVIRLGVLLRDCPLGHLAGLLVEFHKLAVPLTGRVDPPPDIVVLVDIEPPCVRRIGGRRVLRP